MFNSKAPHEHFVVAIKGYLQGYLGFIEPYVTRELIEGQKITEVVIPFAATAPVVGDLVAVSPNSIIAAHRIESVPEEKDIWNLCLSVRNSDVPNEGMAIALTLDDYATARHSECTLLLCHAQAVSVSPRTIRLTPDDDNSVFRGSCILTVRDMASDTEFDLDAKLLTVRDKAVEVPIVSATFHGKAASVSTRRLSDEHFRLSIQVQGEVVEDAEVQDAPGGLSLKWSISSKGGSRQFSTPVTITPSGS